MRERAAVLLRHIAGRALRRVDREFSLHGASIMIDMPLC